MTHDHATDDVTLATTDELRSVWLADEKAKWLTRTEAAYVLATSPRVIDRMIRGGLPVRREGRVVRINNKHLRPKP